MARRKRKQSRGGAPLQYGKDVKPASRAVALPPNVGRPLVEHIATFHSRLQAYYSKLYVNPDEAYRESRDSATSMRRDPAVMAPLQQRQLATALLDHQIVPEDEKDPKQQYVCDELDRIVRKTPQFLKLKMVLLEAIWYGHYGANILYDWSAKRRGLPQLMAREWRPVHGDKLRFEHETGRVGIMVSLIPHFDQFRISDESRVNMVPDHKRDAIIIHKHQIEDGDFWDSYTAGFIHGIGLRTRIYWPWFLKQRLLQWTMDFAERTGLGLTIWYYEAGNPTSFQETKDAAEKHSNEHVLIVPRRSDAQMQAPGVERIEPGTGGAQFFQSLIDEYYGAQIKEMIVGQTLTSEAQSTGLGSSVAEAHQDTFQQIIRFDSINLAETLTNEYVAVLAKWNFPGLTWDPKLEFVLQHRDPQEMLEAAQTFQAMGGDVGENQIREIIGLAEPAETDRILSAGGAEFPGADGNAPVPPDGQLNPLAGFKEHLMLDPPEGPHPEPAGNGNGQRPQNGPQRFDRDGRPLALAAPVAERLSEAARVTERNPSEAQKRAGNYPKGHCWMHGLEVTVENPKGSYRHGIGHDGKAWVSRLAHHYGYIRRSLGADGDQVDVFIGPHPDAQIVFVVDQADPRTDKFDEHKVMLGFLTEKEARDAYYANYAPTWRGCAGITTLTVEQFKAWLRDGNTAKPAAIQFARQGMLWDEEKHPRDDAGKFADKGKGMPEKAEEPQRGKHSVRDYTDEERAAVQREVKKHGHLGSGKDLVDTGTEYATPLFEDLDFPLLADVKGKEEEQSDIPTNDEEVEEWIKKKAKEYGSKNEFYSSDEYKRAYPHLKRMRDEARAKQRGEAAASGWKAAKDEGLSVGDRVIFGVGNLLAGRVDQFAGTLVDRKGAPYVKLDQLSPNGRRFVPWHKGFQEEAAALERRRQAIERAEAEGRTVFYEQLPEALEYAEWREDLHPRDDVGKWTDKEAEESSPAVQRREAQSAIAKAADSAISQLRETWGSAVPKTALRDAVRDYGEEIDAAEEPEDIDDLVADFGQSAATELAVALSSGLEDRVLGAVTSAWDNSAADRQSLRNAAWKMRSLLERRGMLDGPVSEALDALTLAIGAVPTDPDELDEYDQSDLDETFDAVKAAVVDAIERRTENVEQDVARGFQERLQYEKGRWITIGADKSKPAGEKGGTPVKIGDEGRIVAGPPSLTQRNIGKLSEESDDERSTRKQLADSRKYAHARRRKEARQEGLDPKAVQEAYDWLRGQDRETTGRYNAMLREARKWMGLSRRQKTFAEGGDAASVEEYRIDEVGDALAKMPEYAEFFRGHDTPGDQLYRMIGEGDREFATDDDLWSQAMGVVHDMGETSSVRAGESEEVPFSRSLSALIYARERGWVSAEQFAKEKQELFGFLSEPDEGGEPGGKKRTSKRKPKSEGKWITIGGHPEGGKKHKGGTPVQIDEKSGRILKGPEGFVGKTVEEISRGDEREEPEPGGTGGREGETGGGVSGDDGGRADGAGAGRIGDEGPRIVTARADRTQRGDPERLPESVRVHLADHQLQGAALAVESMDEVGGFLLADGTGAGKTRQQLAVAKTYNDRGKAALIVTKAEVIKPNWQKGTLSGSFVDDGQTMGVEPILTKGDEPLEPGKTYITTYDRLKNAQDIVDENAVVIYDESHSLKNVDSARSIAGAEVNRNAHAVMYASATPADKPTHLDYLFRAGVFEGKSRDQVYREMGMRESEITVKGKYGLQKVSVWGIDPNIGATEVYRRMGGLFDRLTERGAMVKREISMEGVNVEFQQLKMPREAHDVMDKIEGAFGGAGAKGLKKAQILMHQRRQQETYKIDTVAQMVKEEIEAGRQPIIFTSRVNYSAVKRKEYVPTAMGEYEVIEHVIHDSEGTAPKLAQKLVDMGLVSREQIAELHGGSKAKPKEAMEQFQSGKAKVMVATVESGGTGINLDDRVGDAPRSVIMMTAPFSAVENVQAAGRVWRMTTKSNPTIRYVFGDTDVDGWNSGIISNKMKALGAAVRGEVGRLDIPEDLSEEETVEHLATKRFGGRKQEPEKRTEQPEDEGKPRLDLKQLTAFARAKRMIPNKYTGYTTSGEKVPPGTGFIRKEGRKWVAYTHDQVRDMYKGKYSRGVEVLRFESEDEPLAYNGGKWITIGGVENPQRGVKHEGGTPVKIDDQGRITAGPSGLEGRNLNQVDRNVAGTAQDRREPPAPPQEQRREPKYAEPQERQRMASALREAGFDIADDLPISQLSRMHAAHEEYKRAGTRSAAFKQWFGDWENDPENSSKVVDPETGEPKETHSLSKVVNEEGQPVQVFHGTPRGGWGQFDKRYLTDPDSLLYGPGFYFTEDEEVAGEYAGKTKFQITNSLASKEAAEKALEDNRDKWAGRYNNPELYVAQDSTGGWRVFGEVQETKKFPSRVLETSDVEEIKDALKAIVSEQGRASDSGSYWLRDLSSGNEKTTREAIADINDNIARQMSAGREVAARLGITMEEGHPEVKQVYLNIRKPFDADRNIIDGRTVDALAGMLPYQREREELVHAFHNAQARGQRQLEDMDEAIAQHEREGSTYTANELRERRERMALTAHGIGYDDLRSIVKDKKLINDALGAAGYDGITHIGGRIMGDRDHRVWIAFEPNQIKQTDNLGTFDPSTDKLRYEQVEALASLRFSLDMGWTESLEYDAAFEAKHPRDPIGEFTDKPGAPGSTAVAEPAKPKKPKPPPPGSQLPEPTLAALRNLGGAGMKLPAHNATDIEVADLQAPDVHDKALIRWRDPKGRTQSEYSAEFHRRNAARKFERIKALEPQFDRMKAELRGRGLAGDNAALLAYAIAETGLRPGSPQSEAHGHFGLSTVRPEHVSVDDETVRFDFVGKSGKRNEATIEDPGLARIVGSRLAENAPVFRATADEARQAAGGKLKDFRTLVATQTARKALAEHPGPPPPLSGDKNKDGRNAAKVVKDISKAVAERIQNTPAVAKKAYIHPEVFGQWLTTMGLET